MGHFDSFHFAASSTESPKLASSYSWAPNGTDFRRVAMGSGDRTRSERHRRDSKHDNKNNGNNIVRLRMP